MRITKFGHSCLLVEEGEARILVDPGIWSEGVRVLMHIDAILLTHEHPDHTDPATLQELLTHNSEMRIYANQGAGAVLAQHGIAFEACAAGETIPIKGVNITVHGRDHATIYPSLPRVDNNSYLVENRLFLPGDALFNPGVPIEILALPVCAPWLKIAEAIDYAKAVRPRVAFPVHDGMLKHFGPFHKHPGMFLGDGIEWIILEHGKGYEM